VRKVASFLRKGGPSAKLTDHPSQGERAELSGEKKALDVGSSFIPAVCHSDAHSLGNIELVYSYFTSAVCPPPSVLRRLSVGYPLTLTNLLVDRAVCNQSKIPPGSALSVEVDVRGAPLASCALS